MKFCADTDNDGISFEVDIEGQAYRGIIAIETLQDHFNMQGNDLKSAEGFCEEHYSLVADKIRSAIIRHPPMGAKNILIMPHHLR